MLSFYTFTDLGAGFSPSSINDSGVILGNETGSDGNSHIFLRNTNGTFQDLTAQGDNGYGSAINNSGRIVGTTNFAGAAQEGVVFNTPNSGKITTANEAAPGIGGSELNAVNNSNGGNAVGTYPIGPNGQDDVAFSRNGSLYDLGNLGGSFAIGTGISDGGAVVGYGTTSGGQLHAFYDGNGSLTDLQTDFGVTGTSEATAISPNGQYVVGGAEQYANGGDEYLPFMFQPANYQVLNLFDTSDAITGSATAVNDDGMVIGSFNDNTNGTSGPFVYYSGEYLPLSEFALGTGYTLDTATSINTVGEIVGTALVNGQTHGYLLTPESASISGIVFNDTNGDGAIDSGEQGLFSITVYNDANNDGLLDGGEFYTKSISDNGSYDFDGLPAGTYKIREQTLSGYQQTTPANNYGYTVTVGVGQSVTGYNFGEKPLGGSISGTVTGGSPDETIYLDANNNSSLDNGELKTTIAANGTYSFTSVPAGTYVIRQQLAGGYTQTSPASGYGIHDIVTNAGVLSSQNFTDKPPAGGSVKGTISGGASGETVYLDANNNSTPDLGEFKTTTASNGTYSFTNVPDGAYTIRQVLFTGYTQSSPGSGYGIHVTVTTGAALTGENFVDTLETGAGGSVSGIVTGGATGETIFLDANNDSTPNNGELKTTTTSNGAYSFTGVPAGAYIIRQILAGGYTQTTPAAGYGIHITVTNGSSAKLENFTDSYSAISSFSASDSLGIAATNEDGFVLIPGMSESSSSLPINDNLFDAQPDGIGILHTLAANVIASDTFSSGKLVLSGSGGDEDIANHAISEQGYDDSSVDFAFVFTLRSSAAYSLKGSTSFTGVGSDISMKLTGPGNTMLYTIGSGVQGGPDTSLNQTGTLAAGTYTLSVSGDSGGNFSDESVNYSLLFNLG